MALFDERSPQDMQEAIGSSDAATRALSVAAVENHFVEGVYEKLASVYDLIFGFPLHSGRVHGIRRMGIASGDRVLEVGVGTGINASLYPRTCSVVGVDLSASMLEKARERVAREHLDHVRLVEMDAADLKFADESFDIVYASYFINCVPDPVRVACEMQRVCRKGGRIVFLNHFRSRHALASSLERLLSPLTIHIGFKSDFDLPAFLAQTDLRPVSIEKVNFPRITSLVTCVKA
jgi:phosphatidylethanolamine/phosphatidyl-N-methylethanolamine N-methyltransferase